MNKIKLICLPFAGGGKFAYDSFTPIVPAPLELVFVELPGRGSRMGEPLLTDIGAMADDVYNQVAHQLDEPYALFGHSMGALLGYLLTKRIIREGLPQPLHLFFTGSGGPASRQETHRYRLPQPEFIALIREYGGSPDELLNDERFFTFYEPMLRADFQATETYRYEPSEPFGIPITVVTGTEELLAGAHTQAWQRETTQPVTARELPGNHFFIFKYKAELLRLIYYRLFR